ILASKEDFKLNDKMLNYIVPTVDEMRFFYKIFYSTGEKTFKVEPKIYLNSINNNFNMNVSEAKLDIILEIFKECDFLNYINRNGSYFIKLLSKPNGKLNILDFPLLKYLYNIKELQQTQAGECDDREFNFKN